jgi:Mg2+ and Co2+ transporter CorA
MKFSDDIDDNFEPFSDDDIRKVLKERDINLPQEETDTTFKTIGDRVLLLNGSNKDYYIVIEKIRDNILTIVNPKTKEQIKILSTRVKLL